MLDATLDSITVGLVQIAGMNRPHQRREAWTFRNGVLVQRDVDITPERATFVYLPYSVGLLQAYVQRHASSPQRYHFVQPLFKPVAVSAGVEQLSSAQVVGFSVYVWNIRLSLAIAQALKQRQPGTLIVFGGPQVPDNAEAFLREHPFIDVVCHGEGEQVFLTLLEAFPERPWDGIPGISYLLCDGTFVNVPKLNRITDLSSIPSPYLEGVFDELIPAFPDHEWLLTCETNRGCPFSCAFCDWGSATNSKVYRFDMERVKAEIDWFAAHKLKRIFICDANFGLLPRDVEIAEYLVAAYKKQGLYPQVIIQNTKNAASRAYQINKILSQIGTGGVTLALQSVDPQTLRNIKRANISLEAFHELQSRYVHDNIDTYSDMIIGLPGETYDSFADGISMVIANGQHNRLVLFNCSILPNAEMGDPEYQRRFGMRTVRTRMVNEHESWEPAADNEAEVVEYLEMVVATDSMPPDAWLQTKKFAWMTELLHYNRLLQLLFIVLHEQYSISYRHLIEAFTEASAEDYPVTAEICALFLERARANSGGEPEYVAGQKGPRIWWPVHQYALIRLVAENKLLKFYDEAEGILKQLMKDRDIVYDATLVHEARVLNQGMLSVAYEFSDLQLDLSFNFWEFYQGILRGTPLSLQKRPHQYRIDRTSQVWLSMDSWCADLVARNYQRRQYLYPVTPQLTVQHSGTETLAGAISYAAL